MGQNYSTNVTGTNIELTINKIKYEVPENIRPETTLNHFIRNFAKLKGTKYMCLEGGCGVCIVVVQIKNQVLSVNSCLVPIFLCNGWQVTTIEGIGGKMEGYNTLQSTLAEMNGSQCGYCSPGMVMNMFGLTEGGKTKRKEIENSFGSNICRCTGYRPILDAFQSFASDTKSLENVHDIEDSYELISCAKTCEDISKYFQSVKNDEPIYQFSLKGATFFKVISVFQIFNLFSKYSNSSYILNGGNTGNGVYRIDKKDLYIDLNDVGELRRIEKTDTAVIFGGNVTLEKAKENLYKYSKADGFKYLRHLADHIDMIGHVSLRNIGTLAGNLMLKHEHREFPSDIFLILETAGAEVHILESESSKIVTNLIEFLSIDMNHKLIYSIVLPKYDSNYVYKSYKIMPRYQNAHADVNAGFLFKLDTETKVLERPNIIFGGINTNFQHALKTEQFLVGKRLLDTAVLKKALSTLNSELKPNFVLPDPSPEYRKTLAEGLFYKFILSIKPDQVNAKLRSGGTMLKREISSGKEEYDTDRNLWPINQPVQKLDALHQTSGEAEYVNDIPEKYNELHCVFALAEAVGKIKSIDYTEAMSMDGFVAFYSAKDVPGKNICVNSAKPHVFVLQDELLFAENEILYAGQPYGVLVANSQYEALDAVEKVKVIYVRGPQKKPLLSIQDVLKSNDKTRLHETVNESASKKPGTDVKHVIKGTFESGSQYHYTMEPYCCVCIPAEDEFDIFLTTQWIDFAQYNISICLGIQENRLNMRLRRIGGSYGGKCTRSVQMACATALASYKLNRPVRFNMTIEQMMKSLGKRQASFQEYEVGVDDSGNIQYLKSDYWSNQGSTQNDCVDFDAINVQKGCYDYSTWTLTATSVRTDLPSNTWARAPASAEGLAMIENIMERIAKVTKKDPIDVRIMNLSSDDSDRAKSMINEISETSDYRNRVKEIESFNKGNRWKKKGISLVIMKFNIVVLGPYYSLVSIYARDGTVSICHAGIEMGQGINTKVAQVAAYTLGIDIKLISIKPTNNLTAPNAQLSAASISSDCCASATKTACEKLLKRLKPIKEKMLNPTWEELVYKAYKDGVDLCVIYAYTPDSGQLPKTYNIYGATVSSVEVDILTGQHIVERVDLLEDTGTSMNPIIDMGQVQGAFIMGLGLWLTEELKYDPKSGALTNYRTWNYKPPGAEDIPVDFRVSFLRNAPNPDGVLRSKATGEPSLCMSYSIPIAIRNALDSARADAGNSDVWYDMNGPVTVEKTLITSLTKEEDMCL